jgi:NADPH:quinone reductase-like Zn-dependent oxidoreductase
MIRGIPMKAVIRRKYGPPEVLEFVEVEKPVPKVGEVLIRVHAASVNQYDWHFLSADIFLLRLMGGGLFRPKNPRLGSDMAGRVETVGGEIGRFKPGDEVFGTIDGSFAEYVCAPEDALALKPTNCTFEDAAALPMAARTALQGLRDAGNVTKGQKVLINGSSGGVGTFALQLAKHFGAEVTAVCSAGNVELARSLGADEVIDYTKEDFTKSSRRYDLILAANGYHPLSAYKRALAPKGIYVMAGGSTAQILQALLWGPLLSEKGGRRLGALTATRSPEDLLLLKGLVEAGIVVPVIDRRYSFAETAEALRYLGAGHARGKVVIAMVEG